MTVPVDELRSAFECDPENGRVKRVRIKENTAIGWVYGNISPGGYMRVQYKRKRIAMHRLIWALSYGYWPGPLDHIDGNKLNNSLANLRKATPAQNNGNQSARIGSSRYKGVRFLQNRWVAAISYNRKRVHLGRFLSEDEAAHEYNKAAVRYFGEFARLNVFGMR